jgi:hypothetical protein
LVSPGFLSRAVTMLSPIPAEKTQPAAIARVEAANLPAAFGRLPMETLTLLEDLIFDRDAAVSAVRSVWDLIDRERTERAQFEARRGEARDPGRQTRPLAADDPVILGYNTQIEAISARIAKLQLRLQGLEAPAQNMASLLRALEAYVIRLGPGVTLWKGETSGLRKGETLLDGVERCQRRVRELIADRNLVQTAPFPASLAIATEIERIEGLAARGRPDAFMSIEQLQPMAWPTILERTHTGEVETRLDTLGIIHFLLKDEIIAKVQAEIIQSADDKNALSHEQRAARLAEIECDLLATARDECSFIKAAKALGQPVFYRSSIDPRALLSLPDSCPAPRAE